MSFNKEQATQAAKNRRQELKRLSKAAKMMVASGQFNTVNEALLNFYQEESEAKEFFTFDQWKRQGFMVKKGEQSYLLWGSPKPLQTDNQSENEPETFFPVCHIFSNDQVEKQLTNNGGGGGQHAPIS